MRSHDLTVCWTSPVLRADRAAQEIYIWEALRFGVSLGGCGLFHPLRACRCGSRCSFYSLAGRCCCELPRFKASRCLSLRALAPDACRRAWRLHGQCTPSGAMGGGMPSEYPDRIRVRTINITAPQQAQRMGARGLTHAAAWIEAHLSSTCSKAIKRLQLGCRKPKLRARLNPLGSTCCNTSHRNCAPDTVRRSSFMVLPLR